MSAARRLMLIAFAAGLAATPTAQAVVPGSNGQIAFDSGREGGRKIFTMNADGTDQQKRSSSFDFQPVWSPDGTKIAFASVLNGGGFFEIYVMNANGTGQQRLTNNTANDMRPAWSPDGEKLLFQSDRDGNHEIYVMNADTGTGQTPITNNAAFDGDAEWSPDGATIAFNSERDGDPEIYVMPAAGGAATRLTNSEGADAEPRWSPDGQKLAFYSDRDGNLEIYVMDADGTDQENITNNGADDIGQAWSPDGQKIAFVSYRGGSGADIYVMNANVPRGTPQPLTTATGDDLAPSWQSLPGLVAITSGPPPFFNQRNATVEFSFVGGSPPPGHFECRLDDFGFAECASPKTFTNLPDGAHTIEVRYKPDASSAGPAALRAFTVDATAPTVTIDEAPSGADNPPDGTIRFHADEPGAAFVCTFEGQAPSDCSSPVSFVGRPPGPNRFEVVAVDAAGNFSAPAVASWEVRGSAPPPVPEFQCPLNSEKKVTFGVIVAIARAQDACFVRETLANGNQVLVSRGVVAVNGMILTPRVGTEIQVDATVLNGFVRATGRVEMQVGDVPLGWTFEDGFTFDGLAQGGVTAVNKVLAFDEGLLSLAKLPVQTGIGIELSAANGGQTRLTPRLKLPTATFQGLPGLSPEGQGLTVEVPITASNNLGLTGGIRLKVGEVRLFGRVKVKDLDLFYDHTTRSFEGAAAIELTSQAPAGTSPPKFTVAIGIGPDGLFEVLRKLSFQVSSVNRAVGPGIFLQRFGGSLQKATVGGNELARFAGTAGLSLGPKVRVGSFSTELVSMDGTLQLDIPTGPQPPEPFSVTNSGTFKVFDIPFHDAGIRYVPPSRVELTGKLDHSVFGFGFVGTLATDPQSGAPLSWASEDGVNVEVHGEAAFGPLGSADPADAVFSTSGYAVCAGEPGDRIGFGARWDGPGFVDLAPACDMGPYRASASAAQAGVHTTTIAKGERSVLLTARGSDTAPKVTVEGPNGERFATPAGPEELDGPGARTVQSPETRSTHVILRRPAAGRWTMSAQEGSAIAGFDVADALPPFRIRARVTGKGRRRTLTWRAGPLPGQRLVFTERGEQTANVLKTTGARRGRITFTPDAAPGRQRTIDVTVTTDGLPRLTRTVARFTGPAPPRLRKVRRVRLAGRTLRWQPQRAAREYALVVTTADRVTTSHSTRRARLRLSAVPPRGALRVRIVALDADGDVGPVATAKLRVRHADRA